MARASPSERSRSFTRKIDAERFLVAIEDAKLRGAYVDPAAGKIGVGEWAERWYATTAHLKPSTRRDYRMLLDHQVLPGFGDWTLASVDTLAVKEWRAGLLAAGLSPKRAGKGLQVLSQVLGSAVEGGRLAGNAANGVKPPKVQRKEMHFRPSSVHRAGCRGCSRGQPPGVGSGEDPRGPHGSPASFGC